MTASGPLVDRTAPGERLLRRIVGASFRPDSRVDLRDLTVDQWRDFVGRVHAHRVIGAIPSAVDGGTVLVTDEQRDDLNEIHIRALRHCLVIENALLDTADLLKPIDARPVLLKGVASAHLDYPDPAQRTFDDIDVLIPSGRIEAVVAALQPSGLTRDLPPRRRDWDRRFAKDITFASPHGGELDLHRTLVAGAFGFWISLDELHERSVSFVLGNRTLAALCSEHRALHAAYALNIGETVSRLSHACDLAMALRGDVDPDLLSETARRWRAGSVLAAALTMTRSWLGDASVPAPFSELIPSLSSTALERRMRGTYQAQQGSNAASLLSGVVGLTTLRDRGAYLHGMVWPQRSYRQARQVAGRSGEWSTGVRELLRRNRP